MTTTSAGAIDYGELTAPVSRLQLKDFIARSRESGAAWAKRSLSASVIVELVLFGIIALVLLRFLLLSFSFFGDGEDRSWRYLLLPRLALPIIIAVIVLVSWRAVRAQLPGRRTWARRLRLTLFAEANGLHFSPVDPDSPYFGMIFVDPSSERYRYDRIYRDGEHPFEIANYRYVTGSGRNKANHAWGFLAIKLERRLPNMVLDAKSNNRLFGTTNLPQSFTRAQRLSLEGDFDKHFTLYCPAQYETDALYVFTPNLMALLIDQVQHFDVEIVDDWMFVYSAQPLNLSDGPTLNHLFRIIDTVGATTLRQTDRYADERVGNRAANMVAPGGRRLKRTTSIVGLIFIVAYAGYWVWISFFAK